MPRVVTAVAAVSLAIALTGCGSSPQLRRPASTQRTVFGANVNLLFDKGLYSAAQINSQLVRLRATGATLARSDALWEAAEPSPPVRGVHRYDWRFDDVIAAVLALHNLTWLPIIDYTAPWAQSIPGHDHSAPLPGRGVDGYAAYAAAFAGRYGPSGAFWKAHPGLKPRPVDTVEIWNEPDSATYWRPLPDPTRYAELYLRARAAIHVASQSTRVIIGGLSYPEQSLPVLLASVRSLHGAIDGVAVHPYGRTARDVLAVVVATRGVLRRAGLGQMPLYVTEFGWTTRPRGARDFAPAAQRSALIAHSISALAGSGCDVDAALLYTWVSPERNPVDHEDWFGISPPEGGGSRDVEAFSRAIAAASAGRPSPSSPCCGSPRASAPPGGTTPAPASARTCRCC